jgi:hypothetical protein
MIITICILYFVKTKNGKSGNQQYAIIFCYILKKNKMNRNKPDNGLYMQGKKLPVPGVLLEPCACASYGA